MQEQAQTQAQAQAQTQEHAQMLLAQAQEQAQTQAQEQAQTHVQTQMLLAGLDIGTTGCKITVYRPDGECLGRVYKDYPHALSSSEHEVDARLIWEAVKGMLAEAAAKWPGIGGIGVTSFGESFVMLDAGGSHLHNAILYTDTRGADECGRLCAALGRENIANITGLNPHPMYSISKLMWLKAQRPELYEKAVRICLMEDFAVFMLTGTPQIDYALASRTMAFDIRKLAWSDEVLSAAGISKSLLPKAVPAGTCAGTVKPDLAKSLGLRTDVLVVSAGHDQVAAAVGSGVFDEGVAVDGAGTVECITPVFSKIPEGGAMDVMMDGGYSIVPHAVPGKYVCYAFSFTGGGAVDWFSNNLAGYAAADAAKAGTSLYYQLEGGTPLDGPTGLLVLPHFAGAATPYMDYGSKAAIVGLTLSTTQRDIFCAIMEGVCYEMRFNMDRLKDAGIRFDSLRATGGGANSKVWMQMKADVLNVPVAAMRASEAGGAGAAMMAGVACGIYPDLRDAARMTVSERETFLPRSAAHERYSAAYEKFKKLYAAVRPLV